jgi:hypothetical protein
VSRRFTIYGKNVIRFSNRVRHGCVSEGSGSVLATFGGTTQFAQRREEQTEHGNLVAAEDENLRAASENRDGKGEQQATIILHHDAKLRQMAANRPGH